MDLITYYMCWKYFVSLIYLSCCNLVNFQMKIFQITIYVHFCISNWNTSITLAWLYDFIPTLLHIHVIVLLSLCEGTTASLSSFLRQILDCMAYGSAAAGEKEADPTIYEDLDQFWTQTFDSLKQFMTFIVFWRMYAPLVYAVFKLMYHVF